MPDQHSFALGLGRQEASEQFLVKGGLFDDDELSARPVSGASGWRWRDLDVSAIAPDDDRFNGERTFRGGCRCDWGEGESGCAEC